MATYYERSGKTQDGTNRDLYIIYPEGETPYSSSTLPSGAVLREPNNPSTTYISPLPESFYEGVSPEERQLIDNPFLRLDDNTNNYVLGLSDEDLNIVSESINEKLSSDDPAVQAQGKAEAELLRQAIIADKQRFGNCIKRETTGKGGYIWDESPECEKFTKSAFYAELKSAVFNPVVDSTDTCGKSSMAKINTALLNFFNVLKEIKKYGEVYVVGAINKVQNISNLIRNTAEIVASVLRSLTQRLRNWVVNKIRKGIELLLNELTLPDLIRKIKDPLIDQIISAILCSFDKIIKGLINLVIDFLSALVNQIINPVFCAIEQLTNALINNLANAIDRSIGPLLDQLNGALGGISKVVGSVFEAIDYILGFESFLCAKPACEEIKKFKIGPKGDGPLQTDIDKFDNFLSFSQSDIETGADNLLNDFFGPDSATGVGPLNCNTNPYECGPPKVTLFGGGGFGAVADAVVNTIGNVVGVNLKFGGSGYTSPPFVVFEDSCERGEGASAISIINKEGQVTEIRIISPGSGYLNAPDGRDEFGNLIGGEEDLPIIAPEPNVREYIGCLEEFEIVNTGYGYSPFDSISLTPDIPNLQASVTLTEEGQIISIKVLTIPCNITQIPGVTINSNTGAGAVIRPIVKYKRVEEFNAEEQQKLNLQELVQVIDCVKR